MYKVEFPNLGGLSFDINPVAFQLGFITINWYGVIISFGFMLAVLLAMRESKKVGIDPEKIIDLVLIGAPIAIIGARLFYVIFSWNDYKNDLSEIFKIWHGGLAIYGGVIGAFVTGIIFTRKNEINTFKLLDLVSPYFILAQGIGRWGNFFNQEAFGTNTNLPWGMTSNEIRSFLSQKQLMGMDVNPELPVHPTFLYESLWNIGVCIFLLWYRKKKKMNGEVFFLYMILYGIGRFFIEGMRTDSLYLGNFRISQILAFIFVLSVSIAFFVLRKKYKTEGIEDEIIEESRYSSILAQLNNEEDIKEDIKDDIEEDIKDDIEDKTEIQKE